MFHLHPGRDGAQAGETAGRPGNDAGGDDADGKLGIAVASHRDEARELAEGTPALARSRLRRFIDGSWGDCRHVEEKETCRHRSETAGGFVRVLPRGRWVASFKW